MTIKNPDQLATEALEFQSRLTEGVKVLQKLGEIEVGTTPKQAVYRDREMVLYRYQPLSERVDTDNPVLIVYALVNRPYIVDLHEQRSLVRGLLSAGLDVYLIDWGYPSAADRFVDLPHYIERINTCVDKTLETSGASKSNLLGICQGGTMSLCYTSLYGEKVNGLVTMVTPVDFHCPDNLLTHWFGNIDIDSLVDTMGNVPGTLLNSIFLSLKPFRLGIEKYLDFVKIIDQKEKVENFMRMEKWIFDSPDQAGEMFRTFISKFFRDNQLVTGELQIDGRSVDLKQITHPILNIMAKHDHLVPPAASKALKYLAGSKDYSEIEYDTGHIGIYVSGKAGADIPLKISKWLDERS